MTARLNISAISRRTGVAPDTLRKWEQRYGVLRPERSDGGQRRYSEQDVARVEWLRDRLAEGWRIGEAARVLVDQSAPAITDTGELRDAVIAAARSGDSVRVTSLLDQSLAVHPLATALEEVVVPMLRWIGESWHRGEISVAHEHAVSSVVRARLEQQMADRRGGVRGTAVLACAPGEQHDLGLLMLAVALRADGWRVEYLGANVPVDAAVAFADSVDATVLCLSAARRDALDALEQGLAELGRVPSYAIAIGGAAVTPEAAEALGATHSDGRLETTVERIRALALV